jgi:hypothetical protein
MRFRQSTHVTIKYVADQLRNGAQCVITFDQSFDRNGKPEPEQRQDKMGRLHESGFHSFYYISHAPFLYALSNLDAFEQIQRILERAGIPKKRLDIFMTR